MRRTKVHLLALAFVAGVLPVAASADGWFSRAGDTKEVTLGDLLKNPREYIDIEVEFKVYFEATGKNFNPYFTRFNEETFGNFSAWPIDARLYDKRDYPRPYPFFFASKLTKAWKKVKDIDNLRVIEIKGVVRDVFKGQPWIEVLSWSRGSGGLSDDDIKDVVSADANYAAGRYKDAARLYERAYSSSFQPSVRADLQRRLGDAYFQAGVYDDAEDAYERGLKSAPENPVLKQGADASKAAYGRARAAKRGETVEGGTPNIAPATQAAVDANTTDEVIRLLEDPATVAAEVDAWRLELEQRAAALRGDVIPGTPVAGTKPVVPTPEPVPAPPEPVVEEPAEEPAPEETPATEPESVEPTPEAPPAPPAKPAEQPAKPAEQPAKPAEQPAKAVEQPAAEQPAKEQPAKEQPATEQPAETTEQPAEVIETAETTEEPAAETGEAACGEATPAEGCAPAEGEEAVAVPGNERVVWVSGQMVRLPRLPFFGCEDVTDEDLVTIIQEIVQNPESDE